MINFDEVLTFSEAAEKWGLADGKTIRKAVERNRFQPYEIKKSGNVWLTTYDAMYRVFGEPRVDMVKLYYHDLFEDNREEVLEAFCKKAYKKLAKNETVCIAESKKHPDKIITILKSTEELDIWKQRLKYLGVATFHNETKNS